MVRQSGSDSESTASCSIQPAQSGGRSYEAKCFRQHAEYASGVEMDWRSTSFHESSKLVDAFDAIHCWKPRLGDVSAKSASSAEMPTAGATPGTGEGTAGALAGAFIVAIGVLAAAASGAEAAGGAGEDAVATGYGCSEGRRGAADVDGVWGFGGGTYAKPVTLTIWLQRARSSAKIAFIAAAAAGPISGARPGFCSGVDWMRASKYLDARTHAIDCSGIAALSFTSAMRAAC
mmetsp:Transcript_69844/g.209842  ORF Transcript_69844/g.209842 Transcript_69844/m.209842 type:complete len:233 (-) Transcript_69844:40-738(-)